MEVETRQKMPESEFNKFRDDIEKLILYLPWLELKSGREKVVSSYDGQSVSGKTMPIAVFDSNLLRFIKDAKDSAFMDRNYLYVIRYNRLQNIDDEKQFVNKQSVLGLEKIGAILSKYVLGGSFKASMWSSAVDEGVFLVIVNKLNEIYEMMQTKQ